MRGVACVGRVASARRVAALFAMAVARVAAAQNPSVVVRDAGPGPVGRYLEATLARPGTRVLLGDTITIPRDSTYSASIVALARQVKVSGTVHGDVIVVGGDLFVKPNAKIDGQAIAIGGGAYPSALATVGGGLSSNRDFTFDATDAGGITELRYRELTVVQEQPDFFLPFPFGLRIPTYDRTDGLSISAGPSLSVFNDAVIVDATATYRSQLGQIDPLLDATWRNGRKYWFSGRAGRETRTNDAWISSDLSNSINALFIGRDTRNYYRTTGAEGWIHRQFETAAMTTDLRVGSRFERARAARPGLNPTSGPWSLFKRKDMDEGMFRPNPQIADGDITSALAGSRMRWLVEDVRANLDLDVEVPIASEPSGHFVQLTLDGQITFPTFLNHSFRFDAHAIATSGDAPGQRFGYLGGSGTLGTTEPLLGMGGDELLFLESRYIIPVSRISLPYVGSPTITFRHILGAAGVQTLPSLIQIVGLRLSVPLVRVELLMDTAERKPELHAGLSLTR